LEAYRPSTWFDSAVVVDGMARSGKSLVAGVLSWSEKIEPWQLSAYVDHIFKLWELGLVGRSEAVSILRVAINDAAFNYAIGRSVNTRLHDASSVQKFGKSEEFLARGQSEDYELLERQFLLQGRLPSFVVHENVMARWLWEEALPSVKMIEVVRHPLTLFRSWYARGLGSRWGADPKLFVPVASVGGEPIPTFALDAHEEWRAANPEEKIVIALEQQYAQVWKSLSNGGQTDSFRVVSLEAIKSSPRGVITDLLGWVGTDMADMDLTAATSQFDLPRENVEDEIRQAIDWSRSIMEPRLLKRLRSVADVYDSFVREL
jgi:hypothetical protein